MFPATSGFPSIGKQGLYFKDVESSSPASVPSVASSGLSGFQKSRPYGGLTTGGWEAEIGTIGQTDRWYWVRDVSDDWI